MQRRHSIEKKKLMYLNVTLCVRVLTNSLSFILVCSFLKVLLTVVDVKWNEEIKFFWFIKCMNIHIFICLLLTKLNDPQADQIQAFFKDYNRWKKQYLRKSVSRHLIMQIIKKFSRQSNLRRNWSPLTLSRKVFLLKKSICLSRSKCMFFFYWNSRSFSR